MTALKKGLKLISLKELRTAKFLEMGMGWAG